MGRRFFESSSSAIVLVVLLAAYWWGHTTHWGFAHAQSDHPPAGSAAWASAAPTAAVEARGLEAQPEVATVAARDVPLEITAGAVVTYDQTRIAHLSARVPGIVWRVEKQVGQPIQKGDVLALIEAREVGQMKADFLQSLVSAELKQQTLARLLAIAGSVPQRQLQEAKSAAREARVRLVHAQQLLLNLGLPVRDSDVAGLADQQLVARMQFIGLPDDVVARLDPATTTANLIPIVAPFDGVVIGREVVAGEVVTPDDPQFVIADVDRMWIQLDVKEEHAGRLQVGQPVTFTASGVQEPVTCAISWISTAVDEKTRTLTVRGEAVNPLLAAGSGGPSRRRLLAHTFGTGTIRIRQQATSVAVPNAAIRRRDAQPVVFVRVGDEFMPRRVVAGTVADGWTEIISGVSPGEVVALQNGRPRDTEVQRVRLAIGRL